MNRAAFQRAVAVVSSEMGVLPWYVVGQTHNRDAVLGRKLVSYLLVDWSGWTHREVATAFDISFGTVKYYAHSLRRLCKWDAELVEVVDRITWRYVRAETA